MINYELAKQLQQAGFPHKEKGEIKYYNKEGKEIFKEDATGFHFVASDTLYFPTLSELIEACGDRFDELVRMEKDDWIARATLKLGEGEVIETFESSPEETVAKLWIQLQK